MPKKARDPDAPKRRNLTEQERFERDTKELREAIARHEAAKEKAEGELKALILAEKEKVALRAAAISEIEGK